MLAAVALSVRPFRGAVLVVLRFPLTVVESAVRTVVLLPRVPSLIQDNASLRGQLAAQELELLHARETLRSTARIASLKQETGMPGGAAASILIPPMFPTQHVVTLNRGAQAGVAIDTLLLEAHGLVGRVIEVYPTTSLAILLTDPNSRIACRIERSREVGLLAGMGESQCRLVYLDVEADVVVGDQVVTAGLGGSIPKGLAVGTVVKVAGHPHESPEVWVKPAVNLSQVEEVLCVPPATAAHDDRS